MIPFHISLKLKIDGLKFSGYFKLTWIRIRLLQRKFPDKSEEKKEVKEEEEKKPFEFGKIPRIISLLYQSLPHLMRIFKAFLKSIKIESFGANLKLGLGSPYETAMISGYLYALMPLLNIIPKIYISFDPDFQKERIELNTDLKISIRLLWIVIELFRAIIKKPIRDLIGELRKMR